MAGDMDRPFAHKLVTKIQSWEVDGLAAVMVRSILSLFLCQKNDAIEIVNRSLIDCFF